MKWICPVKNVGYLIDHMNRLTELGIKYDTDKATYHKFTDFYYPWFSKYINPEILEIGLWKGASTRMMDEFFGNATILAVDVVNQPTFDSKNITTQLCDQSNVSDLKRISDGRSFDIIIDDGSHIISHQLLTLDTLIRSVKDGGIYVVEDIHTSFIPSYNPSKEQPNTYDVIYRMSKQLPIESRIVSAETVDEIYQRMKGVHIFQRDTNLYTDSITAVIEF